MVILIAYKGSHESLFYEASESSVDRCWVVFARESNYENTYY